jgi:sugar phosphate isomerase/epimerase
MDHSLNRREFLAGAAITAALAPALSGKRSVPVAVELFSIRQDCVRDLPGSLAAVANMGYQGVEFAGYYGRSAKELRKMLDDLNLKAFSTHIPLKSLVGDELEKTIEFNQILGNSRLTVASLPASQTIQPWYDYAKQFNEIAAKLKPHKMRVGFHNHAAELVPVEGKRPWDVFFDNTGKDVTMQMHLAAFPPKGLDPVDYINRYAGRARLMHINDYSPDRREVMLGEGIIKWTKVLDAAERTGGIEVYIIEQERYPAPLTPMQCIERCLEDFRKLRA